jgi:hypothetical protein
MFLSSGMWPSSFEMPPSQGVSTEALLNDWLKETIEQKSLGK